YDNRKEGTMKHRRRVHSPGRQRRQARLVCESLEDRKLLSANATDSAALQNQASSDHLIGVLANEALVVSGTSAVQPFAQSLLDSADTFNQQDSQLAQAQDVILPPSISQPVDLAVLSYVTHAANTPAFDTRFAATMVNLEQIRIAEANQLASTTTNS